MADNRTKYEFVSDTALLVSADSLTPTVILNKQDWRPDPNRSVWMGVICPGLGQMYNRSYWKLPIVYGAFAGCTYAIVMNNNRYTEYKEAYRDLYTDNQNGVVSDSPDKSYIAILPEGYSITTMGGINSYISKLQDWQNTYRRYRDISIVVTGLVYALSVIDAYVDAKLFDFDISPDLSLNLSPAVNYNPTIRDVSGEVKIALRFE